MWRGGRLMISHKWGFWLIFLPWKNALSNMIIQIGQNRFPFLWDLATKHETRNMPCPKWSQILFKKETIKSTSYFSWINCKWTDTRVTLFIKKSFEDLCGGLVITNWFLSIVVTNWLQMRYAHWDKPAFVCECLFPPLSAQVGGGLLHT